MTKSTKDIEPSTEQSKSDKLSLKTRLSKKLSKHKQAPSLRITNDNLEEHREDILSRGRKLKYPMQYSKKRLIITCVVVFVVAVTAFSVWLYHSLYKQQQTGDFFYSVTKIAPLQVAEVDGQPVKYQNYLRRLRADIHYYLSKEQRSFNSAEGAKELSYHKRKNLAVAERAAYVEKLAKANNISVSNDEVNATIKSTREADGATEEMLTSTLSDYYGWTMQDFQATMRDQLLEKKVIYQVDTDAKSRIDKVQSRLKAGDDFATVAKEMSDDNQTKNNGGATSAKTSDSDPSGIVAAVQKLQVGQTTGISRAQLDGINYYYIAKLTNKADDQLDYSIIMIKLDKIDKDLEKLRKDGRIKEYISVPADSEFGGN